MWGTVSPLTVNSQNIVGKEIYMNLIKDGTSDQCLIVIILHLTNQYFWGTPGPPKVEALQIIRERISDCMCVFVCLLVFVCLCVCVC